MLSNFSRHQLLKVTLLYALFLFVFNWFNGVLPHQLANMPLFDINIDNTFWLFHYTGMPSWIITKPVLLIVMELLLIGLGITLVFKDKQGITITFLILYIFLNLLQQSYGNTLTKTSVIFPIVFLPFCFSKRMFSFLWKLPRFYLVYMMMSAALFKIFNGGLFNLEQMQLILVNQHFDLNQFENAHVSQHISSVLSTNKVLAYICYLIVFLMEISFVSLLFTSKFDKVMIGLLIFFCIGIYCTLRINTLEILYLLIPLLPFKLKIE